jgi:hypothetical protein
MLSHLCYTMLLPRVATISLQEPYKDREPEIGAACNPPRR